jgi:hypothetical protein
LSPFNPMRGEVKVSLGGQEVRLCVTLRALASLEAQFNLSGFEALGAKLTSLTARETLTVLQALCLDDIDLRGLNMGYKDALSAIVQTFSEMHHDKRVG